MTMSNQPPSSSAPSLSIVTIPAGAGPASVSALEDHPAAALFPMMDEPDLLRLAEDIKRNGLREPIVVYRGRVLDGRNRRKACELAGVAPSLSSGMATARRSPSSFRGICTAGT